MKDTVKFDPGMGEYVVNFNEYVNNVYSKMMSLRTIHQKRAGFKIYVNKIYAYMKNNISFYMGCLFWAYYLSKEFKDNPKKIEGNPFSEMTEKEAEEYDYLIQINFMENYFENFERDSLYYTGKKIEIPAQWKNILNQYSELLTLNKGFIGTKTTSDIVLPEMLKNMKIDINIEDLINKAISNKSLDSLTDVVILG